MQAKARVLLVSIGAVLTLLTVVVFAAPLCFTTGCKPGQFANDVTIVEKGLGPAEGCILQQIVLGELVNPLEIVAACGAITVEDVYQVTLKLLAGTIDDAGAPVLAAVVAPPVAAEAGAVPVPLVRAFKMTPSRARVHALHSACRALLDGGPAPSSSPPTPSPSAAGDAAPPRG